MPAYFLYFSENSPKLLNLTIITQGKIISEVLLLLSTHLHSVLPTFQSEIYSILYHQSHNFQKNVLSDENAGVSKLEWPVPTNTSLFRSTQLPGGLFSPSDKWKKLSQPFYFIFHLVWGHL